MEKMSNNYAQAIAVPDKDLFAVQLSDGGWSIADGQGTNLTDEDMVELAGWHLPVRFEYPEQAIKAIDAGPKDWFDIAEDSPWSGHAVNSGAVREPKYLM
ncbi:hypothetical protein [Marinobacter salarius]|uniref:Uncharacterized protein n=1 Tax=Marinobacter salarius TaxID=1420917 RepID=A0A1W6KG29_9GAMM|nr:hypothetical protein [Marinobacter salarius]ARM86360.1 hypothetical protein MARSALSMR5_04343 [Marinobacter salarius]